MNKHLWLVALALLIIITAGCMGFQNLEKHEGSKTNINPAINNTKPVVSAVFQDTDPNDIPAPVAHHQAYTVSTTSDNNVAENSTRVILTKINQSDSYTPSREFLEYVNAPVLTREQKESVLMIALRSKKFQGYMNESHGPISFGWTYPYSGMVHLSMTAGSATSRIHGLASVDIDIDREVLDNESFTDWKKYW
jgi:hypothetical protein